MAPLRKAYNRVHWFMDVLGSRVVAESGIPSDRHHLGKLILMSLKDAPDFIMQIDAATGDSVTNKSALERTVQCAVAFKKFGLETGGNIVLMAPNHLHLMIPYYAALYLGIGIAPLDENLSVEELEFQYKTSEPKIIFCQNERIAYIKKALKMAQLDTVIVSFDDSEDSIQFDNFLEKYGHEADIKTFHALDFDPAETIALLVSTSGTTGIPKAASLTHANFAISVPYIWFHSSTFPTPTRLALVTSPPHWLSTVAHYLFSPILRYTRLHHSSGVHSETFVDLVNNYKPTLMIISPPLLTMLTRPEIIAKCDISCFETILVGGSTMPKELLESVQKISIKTLVSRLYGLTEIGGIAFTDDISAPGFVGRPIGLFDYRLVDPETIEDITAPYVEGELWLRGPSIFKGYYNQPQETKESFDEDGWFRTGDIFHRDENYFFYFVDRLKLLLKCRGYKISPLELESVIRQHPGVLDVAVVGVPDKDSGELPVACVIPRSGHKVTAQEVKDLVKNSLPDKKQLRGGVIFMKELPLTASTKVHRRLIKEMASKLNRE